MKIAVYSDLHLEFHHDRGARDRRFIQYLLRLPTDLDVLILAGDIDTYTRILHVIKLATAYAKYVVYTNGNHELYGCENAEDAIKFLQDGIAGIKSARYLNCNSTTLDGVRFIGAPLWFVDDPYNVHYEHMMNDFRRIPNFRELVKKWNTDAIEFFNRNMKRDDIVVTHHAPHPMCIDKQFWTDPTNRFYYSNMDALIIRKKPKLWVHGHMHIPVSLIVGETKIESNPVGYPIDTQNHKQKVIDV